MNAIVNMRVFGIVAVTVVGLLSSISRSDEVTRYGRAGGAVGAERIQELRAVQHSYQAPQQPSESSEWFGRAGGPVGATPVAGASQPQAASIIQSAPIPKVYGRAGVPLPFGD